MKEQRPTGKLEHLADRRCNVSTQSVSQSGTNILVYRADPADAVLPKRLGRTISHSWKGSEGSSSLRRVLKMSKMGKDFTRVMVSVWVGKDIKLLKEEEVD